MSENNKSNYCPGEIEKIPTRPWAAPQIPPGYLPHEGAENPKPPGDSLTVRPQVDKYSIAKYSDAQWRAHNAKVLGGNQLKKAGKLCVDTRLALTSAHTEADRGYSENTERLKDRAQNIFKWKADVEFICRSVSEEIVTLEEMRQRIKTTVSKLLLCESIAKECLDLRSGRLDSDLVRDDAEEELLRELALIGEVKIMYNKALKSSDQQQKCNIEAKARIEFDWSDKCNAYEADTINIGITRKDQTIALKPGAVKLSENLSSEVEWENKCKTNIEQCQAMIDKSANLRLSINGLLMNGARDLRTQAERVDQRLAEKISCTDELRIKLEDELNKTLKTLADLENFDNELKKSLRQLELAIKVAQTRLDNRGVLGRPNIEQCRDIPQIGLIEEAHSLDRSIADLEQNLDRATQVRNELLQKRGVLEREIMVKKRSLFIDRDRCVAIRSFYPSSAVLSGLH